MRHYWLDRVVELVPGRRAVGVKCVALAEDHFDAHFPGNPVLPGVCLLEGLAQTAGVLLHETTGGRKLALMVSIERVRFGAFARPGDQVRLTVDVEALDEAVARVRGEAAVGERVIASGRLTFKLVEPEMLVPPAFAPFWRQAMETWLGRHREPADG
ncbi:MAG: 3-hydroxyacyl-ACP dehydratase FabZ family protein [Gemmatimonadales bacterium]